MTEAEGAVIDTLQAAGEDFADVVKLTRELVRVPSRGGIDSYDPVLETMAAWLADHGLACRRLAGPDGAVVALTCEVSGGRPGPRYVLDACLDTAPFGDEAAWTYPPLSGEITGRVAARPRVIGFQGGRGDLRACGRPAPGCGGRIRRQRGAAVRRR